MPLNLTAILSSIHGFFASLGRTFQNILDRIIPPDQRADMLEKLQTFAINNPKLAVFLTAQIAFTGLPLLLFLAFSITVFLFSLIAALLIGLVVALLFTVCMVGVALLVVLPTIFLTTFAASFVFLWGLGAYYIFKWFNEGQVPALEGTAIGDKINNLTGGRISWLMVGSRKKQGDARTDGDQTPKIHGRKSDDTNGAHKDGEGEMGAAKHEEKMKDTPPKPMEGVQKRVGKNGGGATTAPGAAKGAGSGATGSS